MQEKSQFVLSGPTMKKFAVCDGNDKYFAGVVSPIIAEGDSIGSVVMMTGEDNGAMGEVETKLAQTAAGFLGRQLES